MENFLLSALLVLILGLSGYAIYRSRKRGKTCIGCPGTGCCSGNCPGCQSQTLK